MLGIIFILRLFKKRPIKSFHSKLLAVKEISHDTKIFTFDLPTDRIGLNIGEHLELE
jgi:hypothetical protein